MNELPDTIRVELDEPIEYITNKEKLTAEHVILRCPSYMKKNTLLKLEKMFGKIIFNDIAEEHAVESAANSKESAEDATTSEETNYQMARALIYKYLSDEEYERIIKHTEALIVCTELESRTLKNEQITCLLNGEEPFKREHQIKIGAHDFKKIMFYLIGNFILASLLKG